MKRLEGFLWVFLFVVCVAAGKAAKANMLDWSTPYYAGKATSYDTSSGLYWGDTERAQGAPNSSGAWTICTSNSLVADQLRSSGHDISGLSGDYHVRVKLTCFTAALSQGYLIMDDLYNDTTALGVTFSPDQVLAHFPWVTTYTFTSDQQVSAATIMSDGFGVGFHFGYSYGETSGNSLIYIDAIAIEVAEPEPTSVAPPHNEQGKITTQASLDAVLAMLGAPPEPKSSSIIDDGSAWLKPGASGLAMQAQDCECYWFRYLRGLDSRYESYLINGVCENGAAEHVRLHCLNDWYQAMTCELVDWYLTCVYGTCWTDTFPATSCYTEFGYPLPWFGCGGHDTVCENVECLWPLTPGFEVIGGGQYPVGCENTPIYPPSPNCPCIAVD